MVLVDVFRAVGGSRQQVVCRQALFRHRVGFQRPYGLLTQRIGLHLLRRPDQQADIFKGLQGIGPTLTAAFSGSYHLPGVGDIDPVVPLRPDFTQYLGVEQSEPVKFLRHVASVAKRDAFVARLRLQFEAVVRVDIDLRDPLHPEGIPADKGADLQDAGRQHAVRLAACAVPTSRFPGREPRKYRQPDRVPLEQGQFYARAVEVKALAVPGKNPDDGDAFSDVDMQDIVIVKEQPRILNPNIPLKHRLQPAQVEGLNGTAPDRRCTRRGDQIGDVLFTDTGAGQIDQVAPARIVVPVPDGRDQQYQHAGADTAPDDGREDLSDIYFYGHNFPGCPPDVLSGRRTGTKVPGLVTSPVHNSIGFNNRH